MSVLFIGEMKFKNTDWIPDYLSRVPELISKHGGRYVVQTLEVERLEGTRGKADSVVVLEFPDRDAALAFMNDPEYQEPKSARVAGTTSEVILVPVK